MKKALFLCVLLTSTLFALPAGNPWDASLFCTNVFSDQCYIPNLPFESLSYRFGYEYDHVFNRNLENPGHGDIRLVDIQTNSAVITLNVCQRIDFFAALGASEFYVRSPVRAFTPNNATVAANNASLLINTETYFSWRVGTRATLWSCGAFALGGEAQYFLSRPDITSLDYYNGLDRVATYPQSAKFKYQEWQFSLGTTYQICLAQSIQLLPYINVTWSHAWVNMGDAFPEIGSLFANPTFNVRLGTLENQRLWGYAIGLTMVGCERFSLGVEGRFASESALTVNSELRF